jgi:predicted Fe-Mo cluster-binding NifX family protein
MRIAIPTKGLQIDDHFGHCQSYTVYTVNSEMEIESTDTVPSPQGCGCKSNIATTFKQMGVTVMLAGNMGTGALNILNNNGIKVYRGCSGEVQKNVDAFLKGNIHDSGLGCSHHEGTDAEHQCNH